MSHSQVKPIRIVYYQVIAYVDPYFSVKFWRKPDRSDTLVIRVRAINEDLIKEFITEMTGLKNIKLESKKLSE